MKPLHKLILITLFFAILQQSESAASKFANDELCKNREPGTDQTSETRALKVYDTSMTQVSFSLENHIQFLLHRQLASNVSRLI